MDLNFPLNLLFLSPNRLNDKRRLIEGLETVIVELLATTVAAF
jgi:hypothetical protein